MASGFFAGGLAEGFQAQQKLDQNQQYIQLQAEKQQDDQKRQVQALADEHVAKTMKIVATTIEQSLEADRDPADIAKAIQPILQSAKDLAIKAGRDPGLLDIQANTWMGGPGAAEKQKAAEKTAKIVKVRDEFGGEKLFLQSGTTVTPLGKDGQPEIVPTKVQTTTHAPNLTESDVITPRQVQVANASPPGSPNAIVADRFASLGGTMTDAGPQQSAAPVMAQAPTSSLMRAAPIGPTLPEGMKPGADAIRYAIQNNIVGDEYLKAVPGDYRSIIKDIANYKLDARTALARLRGEERRVILSGVHQYSGGDWDQKYYAPMSKGIAEFIGGGAQTAPAQRMTFGNTAIQHLGTVADAVDKLDAVPGLLAKIGKSNLPILSYTSNALRNKAILGTSEGQALSAVQSAVSRYAGEIGRFYVGAQGTREDRTETSMNVLNSAKTAKELYSAMTTEAELIRGAVNALQDRWKNVVLGPRLFDTVLREKVPEFPIVQQKSQQALERIKAGYLRLNAPGAPESSGGGGWSIQRIQ